MYSLGNFCFDGFDYENARRMAGCCAWRSTAMAFGTGQPWPPTSTVPARPPGPRAGDSLRQPGRPGNRPVPQPVRSSLDGPGRSSAIGPLLEPVKTAFAHGHRDAFHPGMGRARCAQTIRAITAISSPTSIASTLPLARLRTQPATPAAWPVDHRPAIADS